MKKTLILSALCMLFTVSCSKGIVEIDEGNVVNNPSKNLVKKTFSIENDVTRTFIDGKVIKWEVGDKIGIVDNVGNKVLEFSVESVSEGGKSAMITGEVTQGADSFAAVYPVDAAKSADFDNRTIKFTIPSAQTLSDSCTYDKLAIVSAAFLEDGKFIFKNAFSLLKFEMTQDDVSKVILRNTGDAPLAGESTIDFSKSISETTTGSTKSITLSGEFVQGQEYFIALAPCVMEGTMELFYASDSRQSITYKTTGKLFSFERNGGYSIGKVEPQWIQNPIYDKENLINFGKYADVYGEYTVELGEDIDFGNDKWISSKPFYGTFDGKGKAITNIRIETSELELSEFEYYAGFISTLYGTLKNLYFGGKETYDGESVILFNTQDNNKANGIGLVGRTYGTIDNIVNWAPVTVDEGITNFIRTGGIVGVAGSNTDVRITNCTNNGDVVNNAISSGTSTDQTGFGGILGYGRYPKSLTIDNCTNNGDVSYKSNSARYLHVGGIMGYCGVEGAILSNCTNNGVVTNFAHSISSSSYYARIGGILGYSGGDSTTISKCINNGNVILDIGTTDDMSYIALGGIVGNIGGDSTSILGCSNYGKVKSETTTEQHLIFGGIVGYAAGSNLRISKSEDGTHCTNTGDLYWDSGITIGWTVVGGICGYLNNEGASEISYCDNNCNISPKGDCSSTFYIGGIQGYSKAAQNIVECTNQGEIKPSGNPSGANYWGGIVGYLSNVVSSIQSCCNKAEIWSTNKMNSDSDNVYAGIASFTKGDITSCKNEGRLHGTAIGSGSNNNKNTFYIAGIVGGKSTICPKSVISCINTGRVGIGKGTKTSCIGGIIAYYDPSKTILKDCSTTNEINSTRGTTYQSGGIAAYCLLENLDEDTVCLENCSVNSKVSATYSLKTGMIIGAFGKTTTYKLTIGSSTNPIKVKGDYEAKNGYDSSGDGKKIDLTTLSESNYNEFLCGKGFPHSSYYYEDAAFYDYNPNIVFNAEYGE